jgi:3-hydroxyacyl-[acyl-carrier-protein] dehydratase
MNEPTALDINGVMTYLPHRYPFLLVDRVLEFVPGKSIRALKNVTYNEPYFTGHFPHRPLMPGVIILEALAQASGLLAFLTANVIPDENTRFYFVGIDKARFRKPVEPGDQLILVVDLERNFKGIYRFATRAEVGGEEVAHAQIMIAPDLQSVPATSAPATSAPATPAPATPAPATPAPADLP